MALPATVMGKLLPQKQNILLLQRVNPNGRYAAEVAREFFFKKKIKI
jgi:hypothetical protein